MPQNYGLESLRVAEVLATNRTSGALWGMYVSALIYPCSCNINYFLLLLGYYGLIVAHTNALVVMLIILYIITMMTIICWINHSNLILAALTF